MTVTADDSPKYDDTAVASDTRTVTVVAVDKLQYQDGPSGSFVDVSGTLYVMKGTTVTFKALPDPVGASWPADTPNWSGVDSGTGGTIQVTFDEQGTHTLTGKCGANDPGNGVYRSPGRRNWQSEDVAQAALDVRNCRGGLCNRRGRSEKTLKEHHRHRSPP